MGCSTSIRKLSSSCRSSSRRSAAAHSARSALRRPAHERLATAAAFRGGRRLQNTPSATTGQGHPDGQVHWTNPPSDVYDNRGNYVGSDPDPRVQQELKHDPPQSSGAPTRRASDSLHPRGRGESGARQSYSAAMRQLVVGLARPPQKNSGPPGAPRHNLRGKIWGNFRGQPQPSRQRPLIPA
jgi:hypothetical protein